MRFLLLFIVTFLFGNEKLLIAKFQNLQPYYYENQLINLKLNILTATNGKLKIYSDENNSYEVKSLNNNGEYFSNIDFILKNKFPTIFVDLNDTNQTHNLVLKIDSKIKKLYPPKDFSNVLAKKVTITDTVLTNYDEKTNIVYCTINSYGGDASHFTLHLENEKLYFLDRNETFSSYSYSAIVPFDKRKFKFTYFNVKDNSYKNISFNVKLKNETVSTQTDIKPIAKSNFYIINIFLVVLLIMWCLLAFYRKGIIYIILIIINIVILVFFNLPKRDIIIPVNTEIRILPFQNSTIFFVTKNKIKVKVLEDKDGYKKIEFNKYIGWIKDE